MTPNWGVRSAVGAVSAAVVSAAAATPGAAQEYCIRCQGPEAVYRCVLDVRSPPGMTLKMLCITAMTRDGGHAKCKVAGGTVFECAGPIRRVAGLPAAPSADAPVGPRDPATAKPGSQATGPASSGPREAPQPPRTAVTRQGDRQVDPRVDPRVDPKANPPAATPLPVDPPPRNALERTSDTVSAASRKAWDCVTSLFKGC